jgi:hypothetical protein
LEVDRVEQVDVTSCCCGILPVNAIEPYLPLNE